MSKNDQMNNNSNLVLTTAAITFLIYEMTAIQTMQQNLVKYPILKRFLDPNNPALHQYKITHFLMNLNKASFALSSIHYIFSLMVAAYGVYFILQKKKSSLLVGAATVFFMFVLGLNILYITTSTQNSISKKLFESQYLVVALISLLLSVGILFLFVYNHKTKKSISSEAKLSLVLFLIGSTILTCTSFIAGTSQKTISLLGPLNISVVSLSVGIGLLGYLFYKNRHLTLTDKTAISIMFVSLMGLGAVSCYWACNPSIWKHASQQIINIINNYSIFFYAGLAVLFSGYHIYRLARSMVKQQSNTDDGRLSKYYRANTATSVLNVVMDLLFLYFCVYPLVCIGIIKLSMPSLDVKSIMKHLSTFKTDLNQLGYLSSQQTQICVVIFSILLLTRLLCSISISRYVKKHSHRRNNFFVIANTLNKKALQSREIFLSFIISGVLIGTTGVIFDKLIWNLNTTNIASKATLYASFAILGFSITLLLGLMVSKISRNFHKLARDQGLKETGSVTIGGRFWF